MSTSTKNGIQNSISRLKDAFPYVFAWEKRMGAMDYYICAQLEQAEKDCAPTNAIYERDGKWQTLDDVENPNVFRDFGIPVPDRLKFEVQVSVSASFKTEAERDAFINSVVAEQPTGATRFYKHINKTDN